MYDRSRRRGRRSRGGDDRGGALIWIVGGVAALAVLGLVLLLLGGAEERRDVVSVENLALTPSYSESLLRPGRLAAEPHNGPFPGIDAAAAAALLTLPPPLPQGLDMPVVAPGGWARAEHGRLLRFALLFNSSEPVAGDVLCDARAPLTGGAPDAQSFTATMALCLRGQAIAEGRVTAEAADPPTPEFVRKALNELMARMLGAGGAN